MNQAVFLDRDGVINYPVLNKTIGEYEAPFNPSDYKLYPGVIESLKVLQNLGYKLFLISNQPDYAKGKTTLENLSLVHKKMHEIFSKNNITFVDYFYCYHHPEGIVKDYSIICECRKPGNLFLKQANLQYGLDMANSWMIGDRDADIYCGQSLGLKTIMVTSSEPSEKSGKSRPDCRTSDLKEAVEIVRNETAKEQKTKPEKKR